MGSCQVSWFSFAVRCPLPMHPKTATTEANCLHFKSCPSPWHPVSLQLLTLCFSLTPGTQFPALPVCP